MEKCSYLSNILGVECSVMEDLDKAMFIKTGKEEVLEKVAEENKTRVVTTLDVLDIVGKPAREIRSVLREAVVGHEKQLNKILAMVEGDNEFEKAAVLAGRIAKAGKGFFLKKEYARDILLKREPANLLARLKLKNSSELLEKYDTAEIFSALRFMESDEWMHETFEAAYSGFTAENFEEREIEIRVLGPDWQEAAEKFVSKKYHNVSHLKEFGVIFLNPIKMNIPGKFLRDFALLLHYFHEIEFYSKLFRLYSGRENFAENLKMLLRGDVPQVYKTEPGEWLIVQKYLFKENPKDPRLFMPRVNPESMHWARGERDLSLFKIPGAELDLSLWHNLDWVGDLFDHEKQVVSFDLEDNVMSFVSFMEGKEEVFNYHQREAMWTKIFSEYVGGEAAMEKLLLENFDRGIIRF